jgi:hypothetical protein
MPISIVTSKKTSELKKVSAYTDDDSLTDDSLDDVPDELLDGELSADFVSVEDDDETFDEDSDEEDTKSFKFYQLISAYFQVCQAPTDQQIHALAEACGMSTDAFETEMYKVINIMISDDDSEPELKSMLTNLVNGGVEEFDPAEGEVDGEPDLSTL